MVVVALPTVVKVAASLFADRNEGRKGKFDDERKKELVRQYRQAC